MKKITIIFSVLFIISACATNVADDVMVGDDGEDARYRAQLAATPMLDYEKTVLSLDPVLSVASISAIAEDEEGNLYILQRGAESAPVIVADPDGNVLRTFGEGLFTRPHAIRIDDDGAVWTVDSTTSIVRKFSPQGQLLMTIDVGDLFDPGRESCASSDIAFAANGNVYISDGYCNSRILQYSSSGERLLLWGIAGDGPGEFDLPHAISMSPAGDVYVADRENGRVQWFDQNGIFLGEWDYGGRILSMDFTAEGELFIGAEPKGAPPMQEASLIKLNPETGQMLGRIPGFAHALNVAQDGTLLAGSLSGEITLYRPGAR